MNKNSAKRIKPVKKMAVHRKRLAKKPSLRTTSPFFPQPEKPVWKDWLHSQLYEHVPCNIAVIDRNYRILDSNRNFLEVFGEGKGNFCFQVYKGIQKPCEHCLATKTFQDGQTRVNDEVGLDREGNQAHYIVHIAPIYDDYGNIPYVIEMSLDVTATKRLQREYHILFERVPCFVAVLNRDLRIVRANELLRNTFGECSGRFCYEVYKHRSNKCDDCPADRTFHDRQIHSSAQIGITKDGQEAHYLVTISPLSKGESLISHVIEMSLDLTEMHKLEEELAKANALRGILIEHSVDGIIIVDNGGNLVIFNQAAEALFKISTKELLGKQLPENLLLQTFKDLLLGQAVAQQVYKENSILSETTITTADGVQVPVRISGFVLKKDQDLLGAAAIIQDLSQIKKLEREKITAERLAAVGHTVAGLAHGIKNILTGLEGGMYVVKSGLDRGRQDRVEQGWEMLQRNITKISSLVKNLLSFSKGRTPQVAIADPKKIVQDVVQLFTDTARQANIKLLSVVDPKVALAALDVEDMHACLSNLVSNALDACQMSEKSDCKVVIRCWDEQGDSKTVEKDLEKPVNNLIFEVSDQGCGMDYEIKRRVFTSSFTTKGTSGTGLGLLLTRKIVQEHGGNITLDSTPGKSTVFRIIFPRDQLPKLRNATK